MGTRDGKTCNMLLVLYVDCGDDFLEEEQIIPRNLRSWLNLQVLKTGVNMLPEELGSCLNLQVLKTGGNMLPEELGSCLNLQVLKTGVNMLPEELRSF